MTGLVVEERETRRQYRTAVSWYGTTIDELLVMDVPGLDAANFWPEDAPIEHPPAVPLPVGVVSMPGLIDVRYYVHQDPQQSVLALTNEDGDVKEAYRYDPYGHVTFILPGSDGAVTWSPIGDVYDSGTGVASPIGNPFLYTGRRHEAETGLHYFRSQVPQ
jgi:hypothetical protein